MPTPPVNPGFFDKVNYVIDAWSVPCEAPWYIYIETMGPAALKAFITLLTFGWDDVLRGFWRPRGLNPRRTGKRKGKWRRAIPRFPEIGEEIGKRIPGADAVKGRQWGCGGRNLWRIDTALQKGFFWWLVADVTNDFAFEWTSLLYKTEWCKAADLGRFSAESLDTWAVIASDVWKLGGFTQEYQHGGVSWGFIRGRTRNKSAQVSAALSVRERVPFGPPTEFRVVIWNRDKDQAIKDFDPCVLEATGDGSACASATVPPNTVFEVRCWMSGASFAEFGDGAVTGVENP